MSLAQNDDFLDQKKGGNRYIAVFKDEENKVIDGIEIKAPAQDVSAVNKVASDYAQDLMAEKGIDKVECEIRKK